MSICVLIKNNSSNVRLPQTCFYFCPVLLTLDFFLCKLLPKQTANYHLVFKLSVTRSVKEPYKFLEWKYRRAAHNKNTKNISSG